VKRLGRGDHVVAQMIGQSLPGDAMDLGLIPPTEPREFRPTIYMERASRVVEDRPGIGTNALRKRVAGKGEHIDHARDCLIEEGYIRDEGEGQAHRLHSIKPYREADDPQAIPRAS
jgi:hypothetical protein